MAEKIYAGKDLRIKLADDVFFHATECNFSTSRTIEATATKDTDDGEDGVSGPIVFSLSTNALVCNKPTTGDFNGTKEILDLYQTGAPIPFEFTTDVVGDVIISGEVWIEGCDIAAPVGGNATFSVNMKGRKNFTVAAVPTP